MNFQEYESNGRLRYKHFSEAIAHILYLIIDSEAEYRLQLIKSRAKDPVSLYKKLVGRELVATNDLENEIKDLAGCRIIFYTNTDVTKFINSGLMSQNFEILDAKIHHPARDNDNSTELYISNHYVVSLKDNRTSLPEYSPFKDMRCEIQIQTILNHAWAEMAHDTIYKVPTLNTFGMKEFEGIKHRLGLVAKKYLVPAGYEFQKIAGDFQRLIDGKGLFDNDALASIVTSSDNNALAQNLETFAENVLPYYDDVETIYPEIIRNLLIAANKARETEPIAIETPFGDLPGKTFKDILKIITDIITRYRYSNVELTFSALCTLFEITQSKSESDLIIDACKALAAHNLNVWKQYGLVVQKTLIDHIESLDDDKKIAFVIPISAVLSEILKTEMRGSTSSSSSISIHRAATPPSPALKKIRTKAIVLLKRRYMVASDEDHRKAITKAIDAATTTPYGGYSNELLQLVLESTLEVLEFYVEIASTLNYETLQSLEHDVHHLFSRYRNLHDSMRNDLNLVAAAELVCCAALRFRDAANVDEDFLIYKTLVGFNSIYPPAWESEQFQYSESENYRREQLKNILDSVTEDTAEAWLLKINRCAETKSNDMMTFPIFISFLEQLATAKPEIAFKYIESIDAPLTDFLPAFLNGLMRSSENIKAREKQLTWIKNEEYLEQISWYLRYTETFDETLLKEVLHSVNKSGNQLALRNTITAAGLQFENASSALIPNIFIPAVDASSRLNLFNWLDYSRMSWLDNSLIKALNEMESNEVLLAMVAYPKLEYNAEYITASIGEKFPLQVLKFISKRIEYGQKKEAKPLYEALPFQVHQLKAPLSKIPAEMLDASKEWFELSSSYFRFQGAKLFALTFPELANDVDKLLEALIKRDSESYKFVLNLLAAYEGHKCIYPIIYSIVSGLDAKSDLMQLANSVLNETGVIEGEFGFVELYEERKTLISEWLPNTNPAITEFVNNRITELNYSIAYETRSAEAGRALRKLQYGEEILNP
jgi:ppGpp synthetase/RelA/SpoT-type nucleotidyltranferase